MRVALALVAVVAACDGDTSGTLVDAGADAPDPPMPDAGIDIDGTWRDTYIVVTGTTSRPVCNPAPTALVVDPTTGATTSYPGTCKPDGSFRIAAPGNLGTYYLRVQGALYETTKHAGIDLSTDHLGRADVIGISGVNLSFNMSNLGSWSSGDVLMAFGANIGFYQPLAFSSGGPSNGSTALTGTAPWTGYKIDAAKSDALQLVQLGGHTTGGGDAYLSLDRAFNVPTFTMTNATTHNIVGAFYTPPAGTLALNIDVASFDQHRLAANPNSALRTIAVTSYAAPSPDVIASPSLISFARSSANLTSLDLGTLSYSDPFPGSWTRFVKIQQAFAVPYTWNNVTSSFNALLTRVITKAQAEAGAITANLSPPRSPRFDGADAFTATNISPVPVVSWTAPEIGTPTDYELVVYEVVVDGSALRFVPALRLATKQTSVRIPSGYLLGQRQYMFVIRARIRDGVDIYTTPLRAGTSSSTADTLTALVTTDS